MFYPSFNHFPVIPRRTSPCERDYMFSLSSYTGLVSLYQYQYTFTNLDLILEDVRVKKMCILVEKCPPPWPVAHAKTIHDIATPQPVLCREVKTSDCNWVRMWLSLYEYSPYTSQQQIATQNSQPRRFKTYSKANRAYYFAGAILV